MKKRHYGVYSKVDLLVNFTRKRDAIRFAKKHDAEVFLFGLPEYSAGIGVLIWSPQKMKNRIAELAERARSYESLAESFVADMRIFRHILTSEIVAGSSLADDLLWDLRDSIGMNAGNLKNVLAGAYKIVERAAQRAIAETLDREYLEALGEDINDRSVNRARSYRALS